ncbi:hypothetical protein ACP4OV_017737 [Aristida adscensionis]
MAASALEQRLRDLMDNMYATGSLEKQFEALEKLQEDGNPDFITEVVTLFSDEGARIISQLAELLYKMPTVDFEKLERATHKLNGISGSVGAQKVTNTCIQLHDFCQQKSRDGCVKTLESMRTEFYDMREKFQTMLQLERQIRSFSP